MGELKGAKLKLGKRQRTSFEKVRDLALIKKLRLRYRKTAAEIAEEVDALYRDLPEIDPITMKLQPTIGVRMVEYILGQAKNDFVQMETDEIHAARLEMIRRYEDLALQCQERFDASLVQKVTTTEQESDRAGEQSSLSKTVRVNTEGAIGYLQLKETCYWRISELRAIIPPKKVAPTNPEGTEAFRFDDTTEMRRLKAFTMELLTLDKETSDLLQLVAAKDVTPV